jgi:RNA polymerase sigma factor (sigma-70 family)
MDINFFSTLKSECNKAFSLMYSDFLAPITRFVLANSGTKKDAEDLFQDTMIVFVEKVRNDHFRLSSSVGTYVMAISKNLWYKKLRDQNRLLSFDELHTKEYFSELSDCIEQEKEYKGLLQKYLHKASDHCKMLIYEIYFANKTPEQIQEEYGYTTKHNFANQKYKCIQQIKKIKNNYEN